MICKKRIVLVNLKYFFLICTILSINEVILLNMREKPLIKFNLIISLYNEKNKQRAAEYKLCLEKNIDHPLINQIHIVYDTTKDDNVNELLRFLESKKVYIHLVSDRPSYGYCFQLANTLMPHSNVIVSNADIFFNDTLCELQFYDLSNKFLAITRWNVCQDGKLRIFGSMYSPRSDSQDVWIFRTPLKQFENDGIKMGLLDCDGRIAFQAQKAGLHVINPCRTIQCCHVHLSGIRNWTDRVGKYPHHEAILIPGTTL
jgi:hypothetical protein